MIIKNNFNKDNANPLDDYKSLSKTRDNNFDDEDFRIKENKNNKVIQDILSDDRSFEDEDNDSGDKWDFFR